MPKERRWELRQEALRRIQGHLAAPDSAPLDLAGSGVHPADVADVLWLDFDQDSARNVFRSLDPEYAVSVLQECEVRFQAQLLEGLEPEEIGRYVGQLAKDDAADLLDQLPEEQRLEVLCFVTPEEARDLRHLAEYAPDTGGGLMTTEFLTAHVEEKVGDVLRRIKRDEGESETVYTVYVVDDKDVLLGVVSTRDLLDANIHQDVGEIMTPDVIHARADEDQEDVAHRILHYNLNMMPVTDPRGVIVGIVTADDALEVLEEEGSEDALLLAGAGASDTGQPLRTKVMHRAPMLLVPVIAGMLIARITEHFVSERAIHATGAGGNGGGAWGVILAYVPMVLALAGTVGMQSSAVLVRGFAVGNIVPGRRMNVLFGEFQVGLALGILTAALAAPAMALQSGDLQVGLVLGLALFLSMAWAVVCATCIALGSEAAGLDPALVSGPVMIGVSDLSSVVLFLGVASMQLA